MKTTFSTALIWEALEDYKIDVSESKDKAMLSYMKRNVKRIIYSYISSRELFKDSFKRVMDMPFYINARKFAYPKLNLFERIIIYCAEREKYCFLYMVAIALKIKIKILKAFK